MSWAGYKFDEVLASVEAAIVTCPDLQDGPNPNPELKAHAEAKRLQLELLLRDLLDVAQQLRAKKQARAQGPPITKHTPRDDNQDDSDGARTLQVPPSADGTSGQAQSGATSSSAQVGGKKRRSYVQRSEEVDDVAAQASSNDSVSPVGDEDAPSAAGSSLQRMFDPPSNTRDMTLKSKKAAGFLKLRYSKAAQPQVSTL